MTRCAKGWWKTVLADTDTEDRATPLNSTSQTILTTATTLPDHKDAAADTVPLDNQARWADQPLHTTGTTRQDEKHYPEQLSQFDLCDPGLFMFPDVGSGKLIDAPWLRSSAQSELSGGATLKADDREQRHPCMSRWSARRSQKTTPDSDSTSETMRRGGDVKGACEHKHPRSRCDRNVERGLCYSHRQSRLVGYKADKPCKLRKQLARLCAKTAPEGKVPLKSEQGG